MKKEHIILEGERHVGKTTLIRELISSSGVPVYGFFTKSVPGTEEGFSDIYIHPAACPEEDRVFLAENLVGSCNAKIHRVHPEVFERRGLALLREAGNDGLIVMDELGFMEQDSPEFMAEVLKKLDGDAHVIASVKTRKDIPFLEEIRKKPKAEIFEINRENRNGLAEVLKARVAAWFSEAGT